MAGGTGGHVFPGLALARYMQSQGVEVHWLGTRTGLEATLVPKHNIPLYYISIQGLRGKGVKTLLGAPLKIFQAVREARRALLTIKPDIVIGMGGFVSGPGGAACRLLGYPLIIHEQNAKAGLTNKLLARIARSILQAFPHTFSQNLAKVVTTGNPVRTEIEQLPNPKLRAREQGRSLRLLVLGGSLGAKAINEILPATLALLPTSQRPEVWHQTGDKLFSATKKIYDDLQINVRLDPFIDNMAEAYQWADVVLCRAGALTVAELCAAGRGAIFIPYPHAVDDHQTANAAFMVEHGAAICIQQANLNAEILADKLRDFAEDLDSHFSMASAAYHLRKVDVAEHIYCLCQKVVMTMA